MEHLGRRDNTTAAAADTAESNQTVPCAIFNGQVHLCDVYYGVVRFVAALSLVSCLYIIFIVWLFKMYKVFAQRQILYLALSVLLISISSMSSVSHAGPYCTFKGWAHTWFYWNEIAWICCITFNLYMNAIRNTITDKFEWAYHLVSWGITFVICIIPIFTGKYGPAGLWCSLTDDWRWRFGIWYLPRYLLITAIFVTYTYILITAHRRAKAWAGLYDPKSERERLLLKEYVKPLRAYPFIYLAVSIFPLINRIQNAFSSEPIFALFLLQGLSANLHGVLNAIVYSREMRHHLTVDQIKIALMSGFTSDSETNVIHEYPTTEGMDNQMPPPMETTQHL